MELLLVTSVGEIRGSLQTFNRQVKANYDRARSLLRQASYWVYDRPERAFGPSKFVGFVRMDSTTYERGIAGEGSDFGVSVAQMAARLSEVEWLIREWLPLL